MRELNFYLDTAKEKNSYKSDRQLAIALKIDPASLHAWRHGHSLPKEKHMLLLAKMVGISSEQALFELSFWNAKDEETRMVYKGLIDNLKGVLTVLIIVLVCLSQTAFASVTTTENTTLYHYDNYTLSHNLRRLWRKLKGCFQRFFTPSLYPV